MKDEKEQRRKAYWGKHKYRPHKPRKGDKGFRMEPYKRQRGEGWEI